RGAPLAARGRSVDRRRAWRVLPHSGGCHARLPEPDRRARGAAQLLDSRRVRAEHARDRRVVRGAPVSRPARARRAFAGVVFLALSCGPLVACGEGRASPAFAARDSAGIRIIELDEASLPALFTVADEPAWVLGGEDAGDLAFHEILDATAIGNDIVVIAEASTQQVIRVDLASGEVRRFGRAGDGPEEFRGLAQVYDAGNGRIGAFDRTRNRYVEIDADGRFVEVVPTPAVNQLGTNYLERAGTGVFFLAAVTTFPVDATPGRHRGQGALLRLGSRVDTLTTIPGNTVFFEQDAM